MITVVSIPSRDTMFDASPSLRAFSGSELNTAELRAKAKKIKMKYKGSIKHNSQLCRDVSN